MKTKKHSFRNIDKSLIVILFYAIIILAIGFIVFKDHNKINNGIVLEEKMVNIDIGDTKTINLKIDNISIDDISWESEDTSIATVDSNGNVTGIKEGKTYINIKYGNKINERCEIIINDLEEESEKIILNESNIVILPGTNENIDAIFNEEKIDNKVEWTSSNPNVATVDNNGNIIGVQEGTTTITVKTEDGSKEATCEVKVVDSIISVTKVSFNDSSVKLKINESKKLAATVSPSNATNKAVTWSSSNTSVATVDNNGNVKGIKAGTATITVKTKDGNKTAKATVTVVTAKIHFFKTGDADSILIESNGKYGLIDAALPNEKVKKYLLSMGVDNLDFIIATHSHADHIGGMQYLGDFVNLGTKYYYRKFALDSENSLYEKAMNMMHSKNVKIIEVTNKYPNFKLGEFDITLMNTEVGSDDEKVYGSVVDSNKESIVAYVTYNGANGTLLTGDMESQDEYKMIPKLANMQVDVLKVAHHSWQSSTTMRFTKAIKPKIAVVTGKYILDDISTPVYYMQQKYGTKFYLTEKSDSAITIDYTNGLSVSPSKSYVSNYKITETQGNWRKLQNGIWFFMDNVNDLNSIVYDNWRFDNGKWYYMGIQGNMMTGFVESKTSDGNINIYYLSKYGGMHTGWHQATEYSPYNNDKEKYYKTWSYSHYQKLMSGWYEYRGVWADGKKWFYFDPSTGAMYRNVGKTINGKYYYFNADGVCTTGC